MARTVLSHRFWLFFILLLALVTGGGTPARAQFADSPYVVRDVQVDVLAESSVKARNKAFSEAQVKAFQILAGRFGESGGDTTSVKTPDTKTPDAKTLAGMVQDFEIANEQLSTKRYRGTYVFRFKSGAVNRYFGHGPTTSGMNAGATKSGILILPFYQYQKKMVLWDASKNPWLKAWQAAKTETSPYILPMGDVSDMMDIHDDQALTYNPAAIKRLRARYGAREVLIVLATLDTAKTQPLDLSILSTAQGRPELVKTETVPVAMPVKTVDLFARAIGTAQEMLALGAQPLRPDNITGESGDNSSSSNEEGVSPASVGAASTGLGTVGTAPASSPAAPYAPVSGKAHVLIGFANMQEWLAIRKNLNAVPGLEALRITALRSNEVEADMVYMDWSALGSALSGKGFSLVAAGAGQYRLVPKSGLSSGTYPLGH